MITLLKIQETVLKILKSHFDTSYFYETMQGESLDRPAFFIEVLPVSTTLESRYHQNKKIKIKIEYFSKSQTIKENIEILEKLQDIFSCVLEVEDRKFTIQETTVKMVDKVLVFSFEIAFIDTIDQMKVYGYKNYEMMKDLRIKEEI
ncbi:phage tail terminator family protein [Inediibacterium massiliense]|uniref:phage tail terminator family protein n=1 Tax=Inediibacterium massiliense TaxID=1658111 RepID=UPI0006B40A72|nr:hypothetical protein [Inediibacterium massiliense]